jgi:PAS domain S-box-containing protein
MKHGISMGALLYLVLAVASFTGCDQGSPSGRGATDTASPTSTPVTKAASDAMASRTDLSNNPALLTIGDLKSSEAGYDTNLPVRIQGTVLDVRPGEFIIINDGTETLFAETHQTLLPKVRELVELTGWIVRDGKVIGLRDALVRSLENGNPSGQPRLDSSARPAELPVLTNVWQIRDLPEEKAAWKYPVRLKAVVTVNTRLNHFLFVQDDTAGITAKLTRVPSEIDPGMEVLIEGASDPGTFSPIVLVSNVTVLGTAPLPPARTETLFQLATGQDGSQWIEVCGVVHSMTFSNHLAKLNLSDLSGLIVVNVPATNEPVQLLDAIVRIRGACGSKSNERRQFIGYEMWASSLDEVRIENYGRADPLSQPAQPIASLNQFHPRQTLQQRISVAGVVTYVEDGFFFIQDTDEGVRVQASAKGQLKPGDYVMASGYPKLGNYGYLLDNAVFKFVSHRKMPPPRLISEESPLNPQLHDLLTQLQGRILHWSKIGAADVLTLQVGNRIIDVRMLTPVSDQIKTLPGGTRLQVNGIYRVLSDEARVPKSFQLAVPGETEITILDLPSWWTIQHAVTVVAVMGIAIGTTILWGLLLQRKVREQTASIQQSEHKFRTLVELSLVGVYIVQDNRFVYVNPRMAEIFGYDPAELIRTCHLEDVIFWEDRPVVREQVRRRINGEIHSAHYFFRGRRKDGSIIHVEVLGSRTEFAGQPAVLGTLRDVTEHKLSLDKIAEQARMLDLASDAIMVCDLNDRITYWNQNAHRIFGWTAHEAVGGNAGEMMNIAAADFQKAKKAVIRDHQWHGELRHQNLGNGESVVAARWTLVHDAHGTPVSILTINTDITQQKKLEDQLLRTQRLDSIGVLAGGIAHDLNNVLAPIMMSSRLLELDPELPSVHRKLVTTILTSTQRAAGLVKQIVTFARGTGNQRHTVQPIQLLEELRKMLHEILPKSISLRIESESSLRAIQADPTQFHQVLMNLCINARDAMSDGGELTVTAANYHLDKPHLALGGEFEPGPYVVFSVTDSGCGMAPEVRERIFDPFFTTKSLGEGTGLGLSTAVGIIKSHGGFIHVQSEPGQGSCFKVFLPAQPEVSPAWGSPETAGQMLRGNQELILVVDDEPLLREIAEQTLVAFGYRVVTASNGQEAVQCYEERKDEIALVLTDMMMPVMDGSTAIKAMIKINPEVKIVAASGRTSASEVGSPAIRAFLSKPYTTQLLLKTVYEVIRSNTASAMTGE